MSVGRIELWNVKQIESEMCWIKGYSELNDNIFVRKQLKLLDRCRNHMLSILKKEVTKYDDTQIITIRPKTKAREIIFYGKPFSYYYHIAEKRQDPS